MKVRVRVWMVATLTCVYFAGYAAEAPTAVTIGLAAPVSGVGDRLDKITLLSSEATWKQVQEDINANPEARQHLAAEADRWLTGDTLSIVAGKKHVAPSGNPHDYTSIAVYSWPNPAKPDGLPWINKDGEVNPTVYEYDNAKLESLCHAVPRLILYARASGSATHARRAGTLLRAWFLDEATRMNPNLRYPQFIPGVCDGRAIGIIDTTSLIFLLDAVTHLAFNEAWTPEHLAALKVWVSQYLDWLRSSAFGKQEEAAANNHGTWFDAQVVCFAAFCDRPEIVRDQIERCTKRRIATQLDADGAQPHELKRTLSLTYCTYNLLAYACIAQVASDNGIDLWNWRSTEGRSLRAALTWMLPYYTRERAWTHRQIKPFDFTNVVLPLTLARSNPGNDIPARLEASLENVPWQRVLFSKASLAVRSQPGQTAGEPAASPK